MSNKNVDHSVQGDNNPIWSGQKGGGVRYIEEGLARYLGRLESNLQPGLCLPKRDIPEATHLWLIARVERKEMRTVIPVLAYFDVVKHFADCQGRTVVASHIILCRLDPSRTAPPPFIIFTRSWLGTVDVRYWH